MTALPWRDRAESATQFCLRAFWDNDARRFHPAAPPEPGALPWEFMWASGIAFSMLVGGLAHDPARYRPLVDRFFAGLDAYWDPQAPGGYNAYLVDPRADDKYYDDNAWMVLTFVEAFERTGDRRFLNRAAATLRFVLTGWDDTLGGGIYWRVAHKSKNACSNGPTAAAALALARHMNPGYFVPWARRIVAWTNARLRDTDSLFFDNCDRSGHVERTKWTYNTALMVRANLGLWRATGEKAFRDEAMRAAESSESAFVEPSTGAFRDDANFSHLLVEAFLDLHRETGAAFLRRRADACGQFAWESLRDPSDGGHWSRWRRDPNRKEPRKTLMANASVARLYWLLADGPSR